jgi:hypothetical protein
MTDDPMADRFDTISSAIASETFDRLRGSHRDSCWHDRPANKYFVSSLAARESGQGDPAKRTRYNIGLEVQPAGDVESVLLVISFVLYYPSYPTWEEYEAREDRADPGSDPSVFTARTKFFRRRHISLETELDLGDIDDEVDRITGRIEDEIEETTATFQANHVLVRDRGTDDIQPHDLQYPYTFGKVREAFDERETTPPTWSVRFDHEAGSGLTLTLANLTDEDESGRTEPFIFDPKITVEGRLEATELEPIPEDFRYDRRVWARGQNCSSEAEQAPEGEVGHARVSTAAVPSYQEHRFKHNQEHDAETDLSRLMDADRYMQALRTIERSMATYHADWTGRRADERRADLTEEAHEHLLDAAADFQQELRNFRAGIEVLEHLDDAERAFLLMNQVFDSQDSDLDSWHLFQLVFIVSNLGSIVQREHPGSISHRNDEAEVLWFPTGGGKTEAYMGLIVFALIFDRIRGKDRGVTAWIRFPLRLLGKQQKDRFLSVVHEAEQLRKEELDDAGERFSIGYFVGGQDTPNSIRDDGTNELHRIFQEDQDTLRDRCRVVTECPACGGEVDVRFDPELNSVFHDCQVADCDVDQLPLYVVDHDIYRRVPSILLGTLDKITIVGSNDRFTNLLGNVTDICPVHGLGYAGSCSEATTIDCDEELISLERTPYDPIPSLHLVDEVHLLNEDLGVLAGQYETHYQELCRQSSAADHEPKVVTSTATIAELQKLIWNLFLKEGNRFPEEGPALDESFYGSVDREDPERRYIGVMPVNKSHEYSVLDTVKRYHQTIRDFRERDPAEYGLEQAEYDEILSMYELSVVYFLRNSEKDTYLRSVSNQINREMENDGYSVPIRTAQLAADVGSTGRLDELEDPDSIFEDRVDSVGATNYFGHGIDVPRMNTLVYNGFPSQTFQYIQSSARVGRRRPGTVIVIFDHRDERDKDRYRYFEKTHEYLRRSIEPVSIDRWSKYSLERTFPGIFKSILLQVYRPLMHREHDINVRSSRELTDVLLEPEGYEEFGRERYTDLVRRSYGLHIASNDAFERQMKRKVEGYWEYWFKNLSSENWTTFKQPEMRSLRDIEEQVDISIARTHAKLHDALVEGDGS